MNAAPATLVVIGAGGFGRETLDVVRAHNLAVAGGAPGQPWHVLGVVDDGRPDEALLARQGVRHLGGTDRLADVPAEHYVVAIAHPPTRRRLVERAEGAGLRAATLVHPSAVVGSASTVGPGSVVCALVSISTGVELGRHVQVGANAALGHDCRLGDYVTVYPGATVSGHVTLAAGVQLGTNAAVIQQLTVGGDTVVGAGAAVVADLPGGVVAVGVPARPRV